MPIEDINTVTTAMGGERKHVLSAITQLRQKYNLPSCATNAPHPQFQDHNSFFKMQGIMLPVLVVVSGCACMALGR